VIEDRDPLASKRRDEDLQRERNQEGIYGNKELMSSLVGYSSHKTADNPPSNISRYQDKAAKV
jgi:hypothetical protein